MRRLSILLLVGLLILPGCGFVQSVQPLSSPRAAVVDKKLAGLWQDKLQNNSHEYFYFSFAANGHGALMIFGTDPTGLGQIKYAFFVTPAKKGGYLNLNHESAEVAGKNDLKNDGLPRLDGDNYMFVKYRFLWTGQLEYRAVQGDAFGAAVGSHKLRGKTVYDKKQQDYTNITLTD
jgi:hypothetical protein